MSATQTELTLSACPTDDVLRDRLNELTARLYEAEEGEAARIEKEIVRICQIMECGAVET
jgi:hypothetical protein